MTNDPNLFGNSPDSGDVILLVCASLMIVTTMIVQGGRALGWL